MIDELVETESYALMNDDFVLDEMIAEGSSIEEIAEYISKTLEEFELYTQDNYNDINNSKLKTYSHLTLN